MEKKTLKLGGLPWWQALVAVVLCALPMYLGIQSSSMTGTLCSMAALAIVLNELGERIPIWNTYIGGGLVLGRLRRVGGDRLRACGYFKWLCRIRARNGNY